MKGIRNGILGVLTKFTYFRRSDKWVNAWLYKLEGLGGGKY